MKNDYDYAKNSRLHSIYGVEQTQVKQMSNSKKVLMAIGFILLVALVSVASCAVFLSLSGNGINSSQGSGYKVNQVTSDSVALTTSDTESLSTPAIIQKLLPSVVGITCATATGSGSGSGIVFSEDGYIVTNQHVISNAISITATLSDGKEYEARLIGQDERTDLAVIKINAENLTAAEIGDSDNLVQGEKVLVIGNPLGETLSGSTTQGIVSALGREIEVEGRIMHYLQTDAAVNPGNSGGPLVNGAGLVVGVTSAKISSSYTEGLGFAIPINDAIPVIEELINNGYVSGRPVIGISGENVSAQVAALYNLPQGVYVRYIDPHSGAYSSGIQAGDVITALNGKEVKTISQLNNERDKYSAGDTVKLTVYRNGNILDIDVVLSEEKNQN